MGIFLVAQDIDQSHRAKFQLKINFFRVKAISSGRKILKHSLSVRETFGQKFNGKMLKTN